LISYKYQGKTSSPGEMNQALEAVEFCSFPQTPCHMDGDLPVREEIETDSPWHMLNTMF